MGVSSSSIGPLALIEVRSNAAAVSHNAVVFSLLRLEADLLLRNHVRALLRSVLSYWVKWASPKATLRKEIRKAEGWISWQHFRRWCRLTAFEKLVDKMSGNAALALFVDVVDLRLTSFRLFIWIRNSFSEKRIPRKDIIYNWDSRFSWRWVIFRYSAYNRVSFYFLVWRDFVQRASPGEKMASRSMNYQLWTLFYSEPRPPIGLFFDVDHPQKFGPYLDL